MSEKRAETREGARQPWRRTIGVRFYADGVRVGRVVIRWRAALLRRESVTTWTRFAFDLSPRDLHLSAQLWRAAARIEAWDEGAEARR